MIYALYAPTMFSQNECLMLINADSRKQALQLAIEETTILSEFEEDDISVCEMKTLMATNPNQTIIEIFSDDIGYDD